MDTKTVYVPVPITERLPTKEGYYIVLSEGILPKSLFYNDIWKSFVDITLRFPITHWLEKQEMVVMTKVEFETLQNESNFHGYAKGVESEIHKFHSNP